MPLPTCLPSSRRVARNLRFEGQWVLRASTSSCNASLKGLIVGLVGGVVGLGLTAAGLGGLRVLHGVQGTDTAMGHLYSQNVGSVVVTLVVAVIATGCSGLYPSLRASRTRTGLQIKVR